MKLLIADIKDAFVALAYAEKWYIAKIEDINMTDQEV